MAQRSTTVVTDAPDPASKDAAGRTRQYLIMMGIRVLCILVAFFIPGWPKWVVIAGAVVLPGLAVMLANQPNQKKLLAADHHDEAPDVAGAITDGSYDVVPGELIDDASGAGAAEGGTAEGGAAEGGTAEGGTAESPTPRDQHTPV